MTSAHFLAGLTDDGVFTRGDALRAGETDRGLAALRHAGVIHRIRRGAYCLQTRWDAASPTERHRLRIRAVLRQSSSQVVVSHVSAAVLHGIELWDVGMETVHLTRLDTNHFRAERDVAHHVGRVLTPQDITVRHGLSLSTAARCVAELTTLVDTEHALVAANSALHQGLCDPGELADAFERARHWPGSRINHIVAMRADGRLASPGESRAHHLFWWAHLPPCIPQFPIFEAGEIIAYVDFAWPELKIAIEFDGKQKYLELLREGERPGDAVFREKKREDRIRRLTGWTIIRLTWADLENPARTIAMLQQVFARTAA